MIFGDVAALYYAKGLPVIPLGVRSKRPVPVNWSQYHDQPVEVHQQNLWLRDQAMGNIGMVLGKQSGLVMFDIDSLDAKITDLLLSLLPPSPWVRVGAKGMVLAYRWTGLRTFRIKSTAGDSICELLSDRTQCVLPPSIHPDTGRPYTANCELLDVIDDLPSLDPQIETTLRAALRDHGVDLSHTGWTRVTEFVSKGSRDVSLTEKAGLFAYAVLRGERTLLEAIGMLRTFGREFVEAVAGDDIEIEKHVDNLLKFIRRDVLDRQKTLPEGWDAGMTDEQKVAWGVNFDVEHEEWGYDRLEEAVADGMSGFGLNDPNRMKVIEKVLTRVAASKNLSTLDESRLVTYISDVNGMKLKIPDLKRRLKELRAGEVKGTDHADIAKAVLEGLQTVYEVRRMSGRLWKYTGSHWEPFDEGHLLGMIARDYGHLEAARRHGDHKGILATVLVLAEEGIRSKYVHGVNFANGFLTEDLELIDHRHEHGMTYTLPFRYLPELAGKFPKFNTLLQTSWGHDKDYADKVAALQEAMCVTLFGIAPSFQRVFLLHGVPFSGKSQVLRVAQGLVPDGARCAVPPTDWHDKFMPTRMHEKLINVAGELSEKLTIDGMVFKDIVDGTDRSGQLKGGQIFSFQVRCAHWFGANHTPKTKDTSEGFNRRWLILTFNRPTPVSERVRDFGEIIVAEEREAIAAWAVQALLRLKEANEYTLPSSHKQVVGEMAQANNNVRMFLEESPVIEITGRAEDLVSEDRLYKEYWSFCLGPGGSRPVISRLFRNMIREMAFEKGLETVIREDSAVYFSGLLVKPGRG